MHLGEFIGLHPPLNSSIYQFPTIEKTSLQKALNSSTMSSFATQFMIETLISSKTRIKLLLKFFLNGSNESYLRGLEHEFGESTNAIRLELNRLSKAGMLECDTRGNKKYFKANQKHPLYQEIHNILLKHIGIDKIIESVINRLGEVRKVYLTGRFANGIDSQIIDLMIIGDVDMNYLVQLIEKVEVLIKRKVRYIQYKDESKIERKHFKAEPLLIWSAEHANDIADGAHE